MFINIDIESDIPVYLQLIYEIKRLIITGSLRQGEFLPSIRNLAGDIGINMHTVNKSYKQLVAEGILVKDTKGFKVGALSKRQMNRTLKKEFNERLRQILIDAAMFNLSYEEFSEWQAKVTEDIMKGND
ncbi:GntR family transcriptional regulator [Vagococcus penaei]|uniref:HTH gntR-type domain-containing protein n=1 Tax=Vagococcus penaei TaxID=633807 RepID=A0A1Q2D3E5_9ENTE|nr:GntR family transcriptional regulator [Vagococcus penaei]AQP52902.1 hypothetical protein BW732_00785 [Vagococcus penaei]